MIERESGMTKEDENEHTKLPDGRPLGLRGGHSEHVGGLEEQAVTMYKLLKRALIALEDDGYMDAESQQLRADISAVLAKGERRMTSLEHMQQQENMNDSHSSKKNYERFGASTAEARL